MDKKQHLVVLLSVESYENIKMWSGEGSYAFKIICSFWKLKIEVKANILPMRSIVVMIYGPPSPTRIVKIEQKCCHVERNMGVKCASWWGCG